MNIYVVVGRRHQIYVNTNFHKNKPKTYNSTKFLMTLNFKRKRDNITKEPVLRCA